MCTPSRGAALRAAAEQLHSRSAASYDALVTEAAFELLLDGRCTRTLDNAQRVRGGAWLGDIGVVCGTDHALHMAAAWHFDRGELTRAADLMRRVPPLDGAWFAHSRVAVLSAAGDYALIADELESKQTCVARGFRMLARGESESASCRRLLEEPRRGDACQIVQAAFCEPAARRRAFCVTSGVFRRRCRPLLDPVFGAGAGMSLTRGDFGSPENVALTLWLAEELHASPRPSPDYHHTTRARWAMEAAALESFMGGHDEAVQWLDRAHAEIVDLDWEHDFDHWMDRHAAMMRAEVEFRRGHRDEAKLALMGLAPSDERDVALAAMIVADAREHDAEPVVDYERALSTCSARARCDSVAVAARATQLAIAARRGNRPEVAKRMGRIAAEHRANVRNYTAQVLTSLVR